MGYSDVSLISLGDVVKIAPFKQIHASLKFEFSRFSGYDFYIFSGNWAHYASAHHKPNMWYCHTPVRAFYDLKRYVLKNQKSVLHRLLAYAWISLHSTFDVRSIKRINKIVTNSENTRKRVATFYSRAAIVINPPVQVDRYHYEEESGYWLSVNRLYPEKRIPLQIDVFRKLPNEYLKIVGGYSKGDHAGKNLDYLEDLPPNVELCGSVTDEALINLYARCKGLICTAMDEDFGMTPLEAMAAGKPVVAVREGGFLESIIDGVTGELVDPTSEGLIVGMEKISSRGSIFYREACIIRAKQFDVHIFIRQIQDVIQSVIEGSKA